jgi:hypothetical protein
VKFLDPQVLAGLAFLSILLVFVIIFLFKNRDFLSFVLLGYCLVCSSLLVVNCLYNILPVPNDSAVKYIPSGLRVSQALSKDFIWGLITATNLVESVPAYSIPLGFVYFIFADSPIAAGGISLIFGALTLVQLYRLTQYLFDTRTAKFTTLLLALSPFYWLLSVLILRDTLVLFLIVWFFRLWMSYEKEPVAMTMWLMIFCLFYMGLLRPVAMAAVFAVVMWYRFFYSEKRKHPLMFKYLALGVCCLVLFYVITQTNVLSQIQSMGGRLAQGVKYLSLETASERMEASGLTSASSYAQGLQYRSISEALKVLPLLVFYFLCSPLPWQVQKFSQMLALADSMMLVFLYIFFFLEIRPFYKRQKKWASIIFVYLAIGILGSALIQGNIGAAERHRVMFTIFILPLAAHNLLRRFGGKKAKQALRFAQPHPASLPITRPR